MQFIKLLYVRLRFMLMGRDFDKEAQEFLGAFKSEGTDEEIQAAAEEYWRSITR